MQSYCRTLIYQLGFGLAVATLSAVAQQPAATAGQFVAVPPCRIVDTRNPDGPRGGPPIQGGTFRDFPIVGSVCTVPVESVAFSLNVTVVPQGPLGYITVWATGTPQPTVSTLNSLDGRIKANAAIVQGGTAGDISIYASNTTDVVVDVDGYYVPPSGFTLPYYPLPACRVADTRNPDGPLGGPFLNGGVERDFPILSAAACNIPTNARAYVLNITAVPMGPLGYLTVWPAGQTKPLASTLNALTGTITANAAIVGIGTAGEVAVYPSNDTNLVIDITGYYAPPAAGGLSLYSVTPCRVLDTRQSSGAFSGELVVDVENSPCQPPASAQAYELNATVVPQDPLGYLKLWPDGQQQPATSTLNAVDEAITSNMAIVPTTNGSIDAFASGTTQLILDISNYFAP